MNPAEFLADEPRRGITGEAAWVAYEALGGDGLTTNAKGWIRRSCPAHQSRSGNSLVVKIDDSSGVDRLVVFDHAGCTPRQILEAAGVDVSTCQGLEGSSTEDWLRRGAQRPESFPPFDDPAVPARNQDPCLRYFAAKRHFDLDVLHRAGVTAVQYPYSYWRDRPINVRARFPFTVDGRLVGAWDRAIVDVGPGGRRWLMAGTIPVPYGWDSLKTARDAGHVFVVEGPTDAVALMHALPGAAIIGAGSGRSMWKAWWGPHFAWTTVWLIGDNDRGGQMTRAAAHAVVDQYALETIDVHIPARYGDVDDWRLGAGDRFTGEVADAIQRAAWPHVR